MTPKKESVSKTAKSKGKGETPVVESVAAPVVIPAPVAAPEVEYEEVTQFKEPYDFVPRDVVRTVLFWTIQTIQTLVIFGAAAMLLAPKSASPSVHLWWVFAPALAAVVLAMMCAVCASEWVLRHAPQRLLAIDVENVLYLACAALTAAAHFGASALPKDVAPYADLAVFSFAIVPAYVAIVAGAVWLRRNRAFFSLRKTVRVAKKTE